MRGKRKKKAVLVLPFFFLLFLGSCYQKEEFSLEAARKEGKIYTYGMGDYWGGYKELFEAFYKKYGILRYDLDMSSARLVRRLIFDDSSGEHFMDTGIVGITYGPAARKKNLLSCYASVHLPLLPKWSYDPENPACPSWYATYYGTLAIGVNKQAVKKVPRRFSDLLSDAYKGKVVMMDPRESATGFATVAATAYALGGDLNHIEPAFVFFKKLKERGILFRSLKSQDLDAFVQGRYPIYFNYDYNFVKLKQKTGAPLEIVIPEEGTIRYAYVNLIPKKPAHPHAMRLFIDFILSKEGQTIFARNFILPVREDVALPEEMQKLLPQVPEGRIFEADWSQGEEALKKTAAFWDKMYAK